MGKTEESIQEYIQFEPQRSSVSWKFLRYQLIKKKLYIILIFYYYVRISNVKTNDAYVTHNRCSFWLMTLTTGLNPTAKSNTNVSKLQTSEKICDISWTSIKTFLVYICCGLVVCAMALSILWTTSKIAKKK